MYTICYRTLARFSRRSRRVDFVNPEHFPTTHPQSPTSPSTSPPIPTLPPHLHPNKGYRNVEDGHDEMGGGSIQWALSRSQAQRYQPPRTLTPASVGRDILERQSLLRHSYTSSYGSHSLSINS